MLEIEFERNIMKYTLLIPKLVEDKNTKELKRDGSMSLSILEEFDITDYILKRFCEYRNANFYEDSNNKMLIEWLN